jgi:hypothetical protein
VLRPAGPRLNGRHGRCVHASSLWHIGHRSGGVRRTTPYAQTAHSKVSFCVGGSSDRPDAITAMVPIDSSFVLGCGSSVPASDAEANGLATPSRDDVATTPTVEAGKCGLDPMDAARQMRP